ncbi:hypothetical protein [Aliivibrio logei]|uniref:Uncharacterized protein n=1 Tax=Aliivibrio logei 5S-186 TaxID=626086 RepID=A0ABX3AVX1_ALILO|nr:hypothetical protein [Aliivibrio logei]OEF12742.1 hypothetical protein A1Q5_08480 [Aliivibrio logei 5S-186]
MQSDIQQLVNAIEGLQSNPFKDYILPIGSVLLSGALGAGVAYYSIDRQETTKIEIGKIKAINEILLMVSEMRTILIAIKQNYHQKLTTDPIQRLLLVPPISIPEKIFIFDFTKLSFILPAHGRSKWDQLPFINTLFHNFNNTVDLWNIRTDEISQRRDILDSMPNGLSKELLSHYLGEGVLINLTDLTERVLRSTDCLIIELTCFLCGFPFVVKKYVDSKILKKYGQILQVKVLENSLDFHSLIETLDLLKMAKIQHLSIEQTEQRYASLYS